ncbi:uncharacterized protein AAGF69_011866 isoform 1-T1 [Amazona ochrocephala]
MVRVPAAAAAGASEVPARHPEPCHCACLSPFARPCRVVPWGSPANPSFSGETVQEDFGCCCCSPGFPRVRFHNSLADVWYPILLFNYSSSLQRLSFIPCIKIAFF